jgi:hypothetical protein
MTKTNALIAIAFAAAIGCGSADTSAPSLAKLTISVGGRVEPSFSMSVGTQVQLAASVVDDGGQAIAAPQVTWQTSGSSVAVDASGLAKGMSIGTVYIKATTAINGRVVADSMRVSVSGLQGS